MTWIRRLAPAAITTTLITLGGIAPTQAGGGPIPVRTSGAWEFAPAADSDGVNGYVAWAQNSNQSPRHFNVYASTNGGGKVRVNPEGTEAFTGGLDGATLIYQRRPNGGDDSDLKLYDLSSDTPSNPPASLNNDYWQWAPTYSDPWILYGENRFNGPRRTLARLSVQRRHAPTTPPR